MYIGFIGFTGSERHVSLVPHMPGLDALCGRSIARTRAASFRAVVSMATCRECQVRGVEFVSGLGDERAAIRAFA